MSRSDLAWSSEEHNIHLSRVVLHHAASLRCDGFFSPSSFLQMEKYHIHSDSSQRLSKGFRKNWKLFFSLLFWRFSSFEVTTWALCFMLKQPVEQLMAEHTSRFLQLINHVPRKKERGKKRNPFNGVWENLHCGKQGFWIRIRFCSKPLWCHTKNKLVKLDDFLKINPWYLKIKW